LQDLICRYIRVGGYGCLAALWIGFVCGIAAWLGTAKGFGGALHFPTSLHINNDWTEYRLLGRGECGDHRRRL
jgi:hypothetical protein